MRKLFAFITMLFALAVSLPVAAAENAYEMAFGDYTVNYNAFPSMFLDPSVSKEVNITRSHSNGVITIAVRKRMDDGSEKAIAADIQGMATNLIGQIHTLKFNRVKEGDSVYYISNFTIVKDEMLTFDIEMTPAGDPAKYTFEFKRQF